MANHFLSSKPEDMKAALDDVNRQMEEDETRARAVSLQLPYIDLHHFPVDLNVLGMFTKEEAVASESVPFYKEMSDLRIGTMNPDNQLLKEKLQLLSQKNKVSLYLISKSGFIKTCNFYSKVLHPEMRHDDTVRVTAEHDFAADLAKYKDEAAQQATTASELLEVMFGASVFYKASDIHFEPEEHFVKVRFRIDGVLQDMLHLSKQLQNSLTTRIKVLAKLKLNVSDEPQDGRITFYYQDKPIDVRVSILPSAYGEEVVMRLLGTGATGLVLKDLGFTGTSLETVERALQKPNGSIITTGPTGSGKTTTLYAFLNELNETGVKIITLEDPVEYKLPGIIQTPISHEHNFDFASGLRAILRQDPDIVMVGEIRDQETAETAMQAALTGHLVLSTLHTNDAAGAIPRLINMGVKPFVLAPALSVVIAQRLVRRLCQYCKKPAVLAPNVVQKVHTILQGFPKTNHIQPTDLHFFHSDGCEKCHNLGYNGRIGIYEVLEVTDKIQELIFKESPMSEFKKVAVEQGMLTMVQDGILKALDGMTDIEEVFRVAGE